jgi:hypothetical protein
MTKKRTLEEIRVSKVSFELGVPEHMVTETIDILFKYMKLKIETPELITRPLLSSEDFKKTVPILKIPGLGFMVPNYKKYERLKAIQEKKHAAKLIQGISNK